MTETEYKENFPRKEYKGTLYLYGASPIEKPIIRTALGRLGFKVVSDNTNEAVFVSLTDIQPRGFRTREPR